MKSSFYFQFFFTGLLVLLPLFAQTQGFGCGALTFSLTALPGGCCYQLAANNTNPDNCVAQINLSLDAAVFTNFAPLTGWQWNQGAPNQITVRPFMGFVPFGQSNIATFCVTGGPNAVLVLLWDNICVMEGCAQEIPVNACPYKGRIEGVKYVDVGCAGEDYSNQPVLSDWTFQLLDGAGSVLQTSTTGANGQYRFQSLPPGQYIVKELPLPGWQPNVPPSGEVQVDLGLDETVVANFGNCPTTCDCDSIYLEVNQLEGDSDTSTYVLNIWNTAPYCFPFVNIQVDSGLLVDWEVLLTGWKVTQVAANIFQVSAPGPVIPSGWYEPCKFRVRGAGKHKIIASTSWSEGSGDVECQQPWVFQSPPPPVMQSCCPPGTMVGPELVVNGNFNTTGPLQAPTSSQYIYYPPGGTAANKYTITNSAGVSAINGGYWSCVGKTGLASDNFMLVDGSTTAGRVVWQQANVPVQPNKDYVFCLFVDNVVRPTKNFSNPSIQLWVGNQQVAFSGPLPEIPNLWFLVSGIWNSGNNPPATVPLQVIGGSTASLGNDFALDCISFRSCMSNPTCGVTISTNPTPFCGSGQVCANATGQAPFSYQWNTSQNTQCITLQNAPCGSVYSVTVTCADGTTSSASITIGETTPPTAVCVPGFGLGLAPLNPNCTYNILPNQIDGGSTDNCPNFTTSISPSVLPGCGNTTVTLTVRDWCGNTATCTTGVQTTEGVPPTINNCPTQTVTVPGTLGPTGCTGTYTPPTLTASDNCPGPLTVVHDGPTNNIYPTGPTTVTYTATDQCQNTATCTLVVRVDCRSCPSCPSGTSLPNLIANGDFALGNTGFTSGLINSGACATGRYGITNDFPLYCNSWPSNPPPSPPFMALDGNFPGASRVFWQSQTPVNITAGTSYNFSFRWALAFSNSQQAFTFSVDMVDANGNVPAGGNIGSVTVPSNSTVWKNECFPWFSGSASGPLYLSISQVGTPTFQYPDWGIDDICFTQKPVPCSVTISANPTPFCGTGTLTANATGTGPFTYQWCTGQTTPSITVQNAPCPWTCGVTVTCADGTTSTASFTFNDTQAPTITCPPPQVVFNCNYTLGVPTATDNCDPNPTLTRVGPLLISGIFPCNATLTQQWIATDRCGNAQTCNVVVTVIDNQAPVISGCPLPALTVLGIPNPQGICTATGVVLPTVTATDNCTAPVLVTNNAPAVFPAGTTIVTYSATDDCNHTATCSLSVIVQCCSGCATGQPQGPELIQNGAFTGGFTGFTSDYLQVPSCSPKQYFIADKNTVGPMCPGEWGGIDHTTGAISGPAGNFFVADGATSGTFAAWRSLPLTLTANRPYSLCAFANNLDVPNFGGALPNVEAWVVENNGTGPAHLLATTSAIPESPDNWIPINALWTAPAVTNPCVLEFRSSSLAFGGNNFALDDISFRACSNTNCTADFNFQKLPKCREYQFNGFANGTPGYTYSWNFGDPASGVNNTSNLQNPMHQFSGPGTYTVTLTITDAAGCTATYSATVTVPPGPTVSITGNLNPCAGSSTTLTASGSPAGGTYQWNGGLTPNAATNTFPGTNAQYTVLYTDPSGCTATATIFVLPKPKPTAAITGNLTICKWQNTVLTASGTGGTSPYTYAWTPNGQTTASITETPQTTTTYTVVVTDANGCTASASVLVTVIICDCKQNAFAQNGDFSTGTPICPHEDIALATPWTGIWPDGPNPISTGDYFDFGANNPNACSFGALVNPIPNTQGDFGGFWCTPNSAQVYREGIMNQLSALIQPNSGCYNISMKYACLRGPFSGNPRLSFYGVGGVTNPILTPASGPGPVAPLNPNLFVSPAAIPLVTELVSTTCNNDFNANIVNLQFNTTGWTGPIDRIFMTRDDAPGGGAYLAVDDFCVEPRPCEDSCYCGVLKWASMFQTNGGFNTQISGCNNAPFSVPCPKPGQNFWLHGNFTCTPHSCGNAAVTWDLDRPGSLPNVSGTSSSTWYPHFDVNMSWWLFPQSGTYSLTITRQCGNKTCKCTFNFTVKDCPCVCDQTFFQNVAQGFSVVGPTTFFSCKRSFKPSALCPNDMVSWEVNGVTVGTSTGNNVFMHTFPTGGMYPVCMVVKRTDPNGTVCERKICRKITVKCGGIDPTFCKANKVKNGDFLEGLVPGVLDETGSIADWSSAPNTGNGFVYVEDSTGATDEGHVILFGGKDNFAGIQQRIDLVPDKFTVIEYCIKNHLGEETPAGTRLEFRLQEEPFPKSKFQILHQFKLDTPWTTSWFRNSHSVDIVADTSLHYLVVCLQSDDGTRLSTVGMDNFSICTSPTSDAPEVKIDRQAIRLYPNPNPGQFTLELPTPATAGTTFRVADLAGRFLFEKTADTGSQRQTIEATALPEGMYFLQVVSGGRVVATVKFVKQ